MSSASRPYVTFANDTKESFLRYLSESPNNRRVSCEERENIIQWLTNPHKRPSSQSEFSRRNYVRKTFTWEEATQLLVACPKTEGGEKRVVVTEDMIADIVEYVHENNGHAGWDYTWRDISRSYYGILRSDVIRLLKQCEICAHNPSKRPKDAKTAPTDIQSVDTDFVDFSKNEPPFHGSE
ncbi:hypothetical protein TSTA_022640 [Talaromyces stipitatus ATCC 10500]|uniref:Integrase zinc-binding domain-containing protein n=1 Tax=Talaromyces stipitatus (strain ATCC 10500 / CBS 375.48 / QM 6759 / NRRL 1006) TaxID=441959 RepID=B8MI48_TALSN|nr:uncharacterized protein TSTA_022640 [Talaromyces stipitatus ATCC 10500]EED17210.1 hypothetical protein TSTA_022640 [Talaromyces stipitatus ATCC 10500]